MMTPLEWLKCILLRSEDDVLVLLDKHPELADLPMKIECSINDDDSPCECFEKYELLSSVDMTTEMFWSEYLYALSKGACQHVASDGWRPTNSLADFCQHDQLKEHQSNQNGRCNLSGKASSLEHFINDTTSLKVCETMEPPVDQAIFQRNSSKTLELPVNQDIQRNTEMLELQANKKVLESEKPSVHQDISQKNFATKEPPLTQDISLRHSENQVTLGIQDISEKVWKIMEPPDDQIISQRNSVTFRLPINQDISYGNYPRTSETNQGDLCQKKLETFEQTLNTNSSNTANKMVNSSSNNGISELSLSGNDLVDDLEDSTKLVKPELHTAAVYIIHIAAVLNKQRVIKKVLPSTRDLEKNPKLWRRVITWHHMASPLHLSIVAKNKEIFCYILKNCTHLLHHRGLRHNTVLGTASSYNNVDFLQLAFASCEKTEMIGHLELPYMYDLGNCLCCAVETRSLDSLRVLIHKGASKYLAFDKYLELSEKLIQADDIDTFTIFIDDAESQNMSDVLIQIIEYDKARLAAVLLETVARLESLKRPLTVLKFSNGKKKTSNGYLNEKIPFLIYSMIINAENVAQVLIADDKKFLSKYGQYKQYSAIDWSVILGKNDLELFIKKRYEETVTNESSRNESPLVAALKLNFRPMQCVRKLIEQGFNLNDVTSENETSFSVSVKQQTIGRTPGVRNQLIRFLLRNGADPFRGCMAMEAFPCRGKDPFATVIMKSYLNFRIIPEILYAGADISRSTLVNALIQNYTNHAASKMLVLILKTGCMITKGQQNLLTQLQFKEDINEDLAKQINVYLNEFPDLFSRCRTSIRSFCGTNLQNFISNSDLPRKIKNSLLFKDTFEEYMICPP